MGLTPPNPTPVTLQSGSFSTYMANAILNHFLKNTAFTSPSTVYLALFTEGDGLEENLDVTGELTTAGYVRKELNLTSPSEGKVENTELLSWEAEEDWGVITHFAIVDHLSNSWFGNNVNVLIWGNLQRSVPIYDTNILRLLVGNFSVTVK